MTDAIPPIHPRHVHFSTHPITSIRSPRNDAIRTTARLTLTPQTDVPHRAYELHSADEIQGQIRHQLLGNMESMLYGTATLRAISSLEYTLRQLLPHHEFLSIHDDLQTIKYNTHPLTRPDRAAP